MKILPYGLCVICEICERFSLSEWYQKRFLRNRCRLPTAICVIRQRDYPDNQQKCSALRKFREEGLADFADYAEVIRDDFRPDGICVIRVICETLTVIFLRNRREVIRVICGIRMGNPDRGCGHGDGREGSGGGIRHGAGESSGAGSQG